MKNFLKGKFGTVVILLFTVILAGVAIFTALRLYQLRQQPVAPNVPSSIPRAQEVTPPPAGACTLSFTISSASLTDTNWDSDRNPQWKLPRQPQPVHPVLRELLILVEEPVEVISIVMADFIVIRVSAEIHPVQPRKIVLARARPLRPEHLHPPFLPPEPTGQLLSEQGLEYL